MDQVGFKLDVGQEAKVPDLLRETYTFQGMTGIEAFDGSVGWRVSPFEGRKDPEMMGDDDMRELVEDADFYGPLVDYQQKGNKIEYLGHDTVDGDDALRRPIRDADDTRDTDETVRIYWHIARAGADRLMGLTTGHLNRAGIGFQLKVLGEPLRFHRTDPAVLYLAREDYPRAAPLLGKLHDDLRPWLRSTMSLLVKRLSPGVGLAEDPGDGSSFGEHRGRLLAGVLADPEWSGFDTDAERVAFLSSRLADQGYDPDRIYLNPGSTDDFPPLHEGGR
jgi:hypothetical protein